MSFLYDVRSGKVVKSKVYSNNLLIKDVLNFDPLELFKGGKQGVWYDPSDKSTLFQDVAGTIPVTKDGDPIGLMKDKSGNGYHATQPVSTARPLYRTDGILHWFESDYVDDGFYIPINLDGKTFTLGIGYKNMLPDRTYILLSSGESLRWAYSANNTVVSRITSVDVKLKFVKVDALTLPNTINRTELYNKMLVGNVFTAQSSFNDVAWQAPNNYGLFGAGVLKGLNETCGYILIENLTDTTELDKYLAKKSGVTL